MSKSTTQIAIGYAFKELLLEKPFNKITVADISIKAEINRQTFYYHFLDIYDLVEYIIKQEASKALKDMVNYDQWQEAYLNIFKLLQKDKPFIINIYHNVSKEVISKYLHEITYELIIKVIDDLPINHSIAQQEREFIANFYKYGFVGLVLDWIAKGMQEDPKIIINRLDALIHGTFIQALDKQNG